MSNWLTHALILACISGTIFFTSLGKARLWDRDEPRNAGCAVEMMEQGQYIVPIFNDELRHQKPVLLYWLMISAYQVFGVGEFAARFWSALLGCGTVLLTYAIGKRLFGSAVVALVGGIATASSLMFVVAARAATPDSVLIFFTTLGIYFYVIGTFASGDEAECSLRNSDHWFPQNWFYVIAMNLAFGFAVLAKGPVGIVLPTAIIGMFLLIQRLPQRNPGTEGWIKTAAISVLRVVNPIHFLRTCWYMRPITALVCATAVAAPWFIAVGIQTEGQFTNLFFLNENFNRATSVMENHAGGWWFYPVAVAIGFFPWSVLLGPTIVACVQTIYHDPGRRPVVILLICWVLVQIGLFSLAETKLPSYVTPCYPALALLTAFCLVDWLPSAQHRQMLWQIGAGTTLVLGGIITSAALIYAAGEFFPEIVWISAIGLVPVLGGCFGIWFSLRRQPNLLIRTMAITSVVFCWLFFGVGTVAVDSARQTHVVLNDIKDSGSGRKVASFHCLESSWVFYIGRPIYELNRGADNTEIQPLSRDRWWHRKPEISPEDFVQQNPDAWLVTTDQHVDELLARLPKGYSVVKDADFFLKSNRHLLLIENTKQATAKVNTSNVQR